MNARFSTAMALVVGVAAACGGDGSDVLTYDEFKAAAYQEPDTGAYVLNGDELIESEEAMHDLYDRYLDSVAAAADRADGLGTAASNLIVNRVGGADDRWPAATAANLTYCVSQSSFGSRYAAVVSAMDSAGECQDRCRVSGGQLFRSTARWSGFNRTTAMGFQLRV